MFPFKREKSSRSLFTMKRRPNTHHPLKALTLALPRTSSPHRSSQDQCASTLTDYGKKNSRDKNIYSCHSDILLTIKSNCYNFISNASLFAQARGNCANVIGVAVISSEIIFGALTLRLPCSSLEKKASHIVHSWSTINTSNFNYIFFHVADEGFIISMLYSNPCGSCGAGVHWSCYEVRVMIAVTQTLTHRLAQALNPLGCRKK